MAETAEFKALRENIVAIRACISEPDVLKFAGELFQDGLVSDAGHDTAIAVTGTPPGTVVARLVNEAMNKVGNSPDHFYKLVSILESRNKALASTLRSAYSELHGGIMDTTNATSQRVQQTDQSSTALGYRPGKPQSIDVSHDQIKVKWSQPGQGAAHDTNFYVIAYRSVTDPESKWLSCTSQHSNSAIIVGLTPNTKYVFKVRADTVDAGSSPYSDLSDPIQTMLPPPGKPYATNVSYETCKSIHIAWEKPECDGIQYYCISYRSDGDPADKWSTIMTDSDENSYNFGGKFCKQYVFKVSAVTAAGASSESEVSEPIKTLVKPRRARLLSSCKLISPRENQITRIYQLPLYYPLMKKCIRKAYVGDHLVRSTIAEHVPHKVLMLVGATGSGKSTLINGMANYIMGVDWEDEYRFKLIPEEETEHEQSKSQTKCITAYTFYKDENSSLSYTLTVIDTPRLGGTEGLEGDKGIIKTIKEFFSLKGDEGIDQLHGIGFVTQAPQARLTPTLRYVFDSILSVFGKDVADNIFLMVTFADGGRPPVLDAVLTAEVPFSSHFKFNNSALYASNLESDDELFWRMGKKGFAEFFDHLYDTKSQSLRLSREVMKEHDRLEITTQRLQSLIRARIAKVDEIKQEQQIVRDHEADVIASKDFTYRVQITKQRKTDVPPGRHVTNCLQCNCTCHYPCPYAADDSKYNCRTMNNRGSQDATCGVCPGKCSWRYHVNSPYKFEIYQETETRTSDELKAKYDAAMTAQTLAEVVIYKMEEELKEMNHAVSQEVEHARQSLQQLQKMTLRPDCLTEVEYIDSLIETEKQEAHPGWRERVKALQKLQEEAEIIHA